MAEATTPDLEDLLSDLIDDPSLEELNRRFGRLNLFEALGSVRRELNHSNFLAFLLSPSRPHGLGAEPLRRVLRSFAEVIPKPMRSVRPLDIVIGDLDDAIVFRERDNIDLLIEVPSLRLAAIVENKIGADESAGQLARYATAVRTNYPDWRHMFIFLTPDGIEAEHKDYASFSYAQMAEIVDDFVEEARGSEIGVILRHYVETLRRHVVPDERLKELALQIYERHKEALDFIFDCRPEPGSLLGLVRDLMSQTPQLALDRQVVSIARFAPESWSNIKSLNACPQELWTRTGRNILFEVKSFKTEAYDFSDRILLSLILGPSEPAVREYFFEAARSRPDIFSGSGTSIGKSWTTLFSKELLTKNAAKRMDDEQKATALTAAWQTFAAQNLPKLTNELIDLAKRAPFS